MSSNPHSACRAFEEALLRRLDEEGADARLPETFGHAADCADCRTLVTLLNAASETLRTLAPPRPPVRLIRTLTAPPSDFADRRSSAEVLDFLRPGALAAPEPSPELMGRLLYLPTRVKAAAGAQAAPAPSAWKRLFSDWRVLVAAAYAVTLAVVSVLGVDPMSAARGAASSLTSAGERAVEDAKQAALARLDAAATAEAGRPLTERLDYRIYRTLASGRARAAAYAQIAFERVFGSTAEAAATPSPARPGGAGPGRDIRPAATPEPDGKVLRS